ncbi:hypothetical protein JJB07_07900 [Tumebacillus sp. ITR2]|uniref:Uncharacterized protein n=1 Tax=Tumebacillus amylolyticus TaxID=2801339 RepID=A0ABS1J8R3_9BACL|nr:hypothetical protein [Tumebacillus amylolyticus]MBL0386570.1 hypothetical protein [Tumebacillus amylolyticus]
MFIGILATLILIGIVIGQVRESKKSGLLSLARVAYEERAVRYEGPVTYLRGPWEDVEAGARLYLSVLDGVVCLVSPQKRMLALEGAEVAGLELADPREAVLTLRGADTEVSVKAHPERAQMIARTI